MIIKLYGVILSSGLFYFIKDGLFGGSTFRPALLDIFLYGSHEEEDPIMFHFYPHSTATSEAKAGHFSVGNNNQFCSDSDDSFI